MRFGSKIVYISIFSIKYDFILYFTDPTTLYEGVLSKTELPAKKTIDMWDGEAWKMGLRDRYQLLAVRKILGKQQLSILPVSC